MSADGLENGSSNVDLHVLDAKRSRHDSLDVISCEENNTNKVFF